MNCSSWATVEIRFYPVGSLVMGHTLDFWSLGEKIASTLLDKALLIGTIFAAVRYRLFRILSRRYCSSLHCKHFRLLVVGSWIVIISWKILKITQPTYVRYRSGFILGPR
jgi:hypothetical protein